jgi:large subunit ribosomal protein L35
MPKLKTRKGIRKRFRITKSGKIKHGAAGKGHLLSSKEEERKRKLKRAVLVDKTQKRMIKRMLPYG